MRYSLEPKYRKYVQGYGFFSFARKCGDKYGKKLMDTAIKAGIDAAKNSSKRVVQKTAKTAGDLVGNKKTNSLGKSKNKQKEYKTNEVEEIYFPPEKRQQVIDDLRLDTKRLQTY